MLNNFIQIHATLHRGNCLPPCRRSGKFGTQSSSLNAVFWAGTFTPHEPPEPSARSLRHRTVNGSVSHNRTFRKRVFLVWRAKLRVQNLGLSFDLDAALPRRDSCGLVGKTFSDGIAAP